MTATRPPIRVQTVTDPSAPDDIEVVGADVDEEFLAQLIANERFVEVVDQNEVHLHLSFDMDGETLVCQRWEPIDDQGAGEGPHPRG